MPTFLLGKRCVLTPGRPSHYDTISKTGKFEGAVWEEEKMAVLLFSLGISLLEDTNYIYVQGGVDIILG